MLLNRFRGMLLAACLCGSIALPAPMATAGQLHDLFGVASSSVEQSTDRAVTRDRKVKRQRLVTVDPAAIVAEILPSGHDRSPGRAALSESLPGTVNLNLFDDVSITAQRGSVEDAFGGGVVWTGKTDGQGYAILVVDGNRITGAIESGGRRFLIESTGNGLVHRVKEVDSEAYPRDQHIELPKHLMQESQTGSGPLSPSTTRTTTTITYVTLLAAYTSRAKTILGSTPAQTIALDVAIVNQGMANSGVPMRIKLVGTVAVSTSYDERSAADATRPLYDVTSGTGYNFPGIRNSRNSLKADLVTMYADRPEYCGIAWVLEQDLIARYAYSVINARCKGTAALAHELGHNMGLRHDRYVEAGASSSAYNYGYVNTAGKFRDIMSYPNKCAALGITCRSITYYSNPWKSYLGYPIGIPTGQPGAANNARKLRENIAGLAAFR